MRETTGGVGVFAAADDYASIGEHGGCEVEAVLVRVGKARPGPVGVAAGAIRRQLPPAAHTYRLPEGAGAFLNHDGSVGKQERGSTIGIGNTEDDRDDAPDGAENVDKDRPYRARNGDLESTDL